jgi:hypothetical protein
MNVYPKLQVRLVGLDLDSGHRNTDTIKPRRRSFRGFIVSVVNESLFPQTLVPQGSVRARQF